MKKRSSLLIFLMIAITSYAQEDRKRGDKPSIPVSITVSTDRVSAEYIDVPFYSAQILNELNKSQDVNFVMAASDQTPVILINVSVANLNIGQRKQRSVNRPGRYMQVVGTDSRGLSITRTVDVIVEELTVDRNTSATFNTSISWQDGTSPMLSKTFNSIYNYSKTTSFSPETRTIRSSNHLSTKEIPEPRTDEYLFLLTKKDLAPYLSSELRKIYDRRDQTARAN